MKFFRICIFIFLLIFLFYCKSSAHKNKEISRIRSPINIPKYNNVEEKNQIQPAVPQKAYSVKNKLAYLNNAPKFNISEPIDNDEIISTPCDNSVNSNKKTQTNTVPRNNQGNNSIIENETINTVLLSTCLNIEERKEDIKSNKQPEKMPINSPSNEIASSCLPADTLNPSLPKQPVALTSILNKAINAGIQSEKSISNRRKRPSDPGTALPTTLLTEDTEVKELIAKISYDLDENIKNNPGKKSENIMEDMGLGILLLQSKVNSIERLYPVNSGVLYKIIFEEPVDLSNKHEIKANVLWYEPKYFIKDLALESNSFSDSVLEQIKAKEWYIRSLGIEEVTQNLISPASNETKEVVTVAVIDTGVDYSYPEISEKTWTNEDEIPNNGIDDDKNGYIDDDYGWNFVDNNNDILDIDGHGTNVAKIISGMNNCIRIMPVKVLTKEGGNTQNIAEGIHYAINNGAKVLNISFGGDMPSEMVKDVINDAYKKGCVIITAAGNSGSDTPLYPSSYRSVISVGAYNIFWNPTNFTNKFVDIYAPGQDIYSSNTYISGTSFATPFVSGLAASLLSLIPDLTPMEILYNLKAQGIFESGISTSGETQHNEPPVGYGYGNLNAFLIYFPEFILRRTCRILNPNLNSIVNKTIKITAIASTDASSYSLDITRGTSLEDGQGLIHIKTYDRPITENDNIVFDTSILSNGYHTIILTGYLKDNTSRYIDRDYVRIYINNPQATEDETVQNDTDISDKTILIGSLCINGQTKLHLVNNSKELREAYLKFYISGETVSSNESILLEPSKDTEIDLNKYSSLLSDSEIYSLEAEISSENSNVSGYLDNTFPDKNIRIKLSSIKPLSIQFLSSFSARIDNVYSSYIVLVNRKDKSIRFKPVFNINGQEVHSPHSGIVEACDTIIIDLARYLPGPITKYQGFIGIDYTGKDLEGLTATLLVLNKNNNSYYTENFIGITGKNCGFTEIGYLSAQWKPEKASKAERDNLINIESKKFSYEAKLVFYNPTDNNAFFNLTISQDGSLFDKGYRLDKHWYWQGKEYDIYEPYGERYTRFLRKWDSNRPDTFEYSIQFSGALPLDLSLATILDIAETTKIKGNHPSTYVNKIIPSHYISLKISSKQQINSEYYLYPFRNYSLVTKLKGESDENGFYGIDTSSLIVHGPINVPARSIISVPTWNIPSFELNSPIDYFCANKCMVTNVCPKNSLICAVVTEKDGVIQEVIPLESRLFE